VRFSRGEKFLYINNYLIESSVEILRAMQKFWVLLGLWDLSQPRGEGPKALQFKAHLAEID
jgi:hypothetical protein